MSGAVAILLVLLVAFVVGGVIYLLNKLLPGGIFGALSSDEDTQIAVTSGRDDPSGQLYKIKQAEDSPGDFQFVPSDSVEIELPEESDEPGEPENLKTIEPLV